MSSGVIFTVRPVIKNQQADLGEDKTGVELRFSEDEEGFELHFAGRLLLSHTRERPALSMARGASAVTMLRGNFRIDDAPSDRLEPRMAG